MAADSPRGVAASGLRATLACADISPTVNLPAGDNTVQAPDAAAQVHYSYRLNIQAGLFLPPGDHTNMLVEHELPCATV